MSLGTSPNPLISSTTEGLETNKWKCIIADESNGKTTKEGVYAGGDAVTGAATVILAMEAGRAGARGIDEYLNGNKQVNIVSEIQKAGIRGMSVVDRRAWMPVFLQWWIGRWCVWFMEFGMCGCGGDGGVGGWIVGEVW